MRQIFRMFEGKSRQEWEHTSGLIEAIVNVQSTEKITAISRNPWRWHEEIEHGHITDMREAIGGDTVKITGWKLPGINC